MRKFTLILSLLVAMVTTAMAQMPQVSEDPVNNEWNENTTWYYIQLNQTKGFLSIADGYVQDEALKVNNTTRPTDDNGLWCIVGDATNGYKFYNKGAGTTKTLGMTGSEDGGRGKMYEITDETERVQLFDFTNSNVSGYISIKDHGTDSKYFNNRNSYLAYWDTNSALSGTGSAFMFMTPEEVNIALLELENSLSAADAIITSANVQGSESEIELQVTNPDAANYLSCNAEQNTVGNTPDGGGMAHLIDDIVGNSSNYMHTQWDGTSVGEDHYLQIDFGAEGAIDEFTFTYTTRNDNWAKHPISMNVVAFNNIDETPVAITSFNDLTKNYNATEKRTVSADNAYRYYRLIVTQSSDVYGNKANYFAMAEFGVSISSYTTNPGYEDALYQVLDLQTVCNTVNGSKAQGIVQLNEAIQTVNNAIYAVEDITSPEKSALRYKIAEMQVYVDLFGDKVGNYRTNQALINAITTAEDVLNNSTSTATDYTNATETFANITPELILPEEGKYYIITNHQEANRKMYVNDFDYHLYHHNGICGLSHVFQFQKTDGGYYMYNVGTGTYLSTAKAHAYGQEASEAISVEDAKVVALTSWDTERQMCITPIGGGQLHADWHGTTVAWNEEANSRSAWYIDEIDITALSHTLSVGETLHATLKLDYNTTIPTGVKAYVATVDGTEATLNEVTGGILPANTAVIIIADAKGNYTFNYTSSNATFSGDNDLKGITHSTTITPANNNYYVLANGANGIGLYKVENDVDTNEDTTTFEAFTLGANKAYLSIAGETENNVFSFRIEGTTAIDEVEAAEAGEQVIYDLTGRRVESISAPGIYIVNGKKVVIK